jgi:hypothetical protein
VWIKSVEYARGKYGRTLAEIYNPAGDQCLNAILKEMLNQ